MSVLALEQTSFWLGVLVTVIAQLWAVTVAVALAVALPTPAIVSPVKTAVFVVVFVIVAVPVTVVLPPTGIEPTLIVTSSDLSLGVPRSSTILPFVIATFPVLSTLYEQVMSVLALEQTSVWLGVLVSSTLGLRVCRLPW